MLIEIQGVQCINKGAELMLIAVAQQVRQHLPEASLVLAPGRNTRPYEWRVQFDAYQKLGWMPRGYPVGEYISWAVPQRIRKAFGLVRHSEIHVILDASGFAYGDQWGALKTIAMAKAARMIKRQNGSVILLPQAMGPFGGEEISRAFCQIVDNADLVFPRDEESLKHAESVVGARSNVILAPDFTNLVAGEPSEWMERSGGRVAVIPNEKMVSSTLPEKAQAYIPFLIKCIECLEDDGAHPFVLLHESNKDVALAKNLQDSIGRKLDVVSEPDPLKLKGIIGSCSAVISSRFHGLVSALSQGVPAIATGWSHKYSTLMKEYGLAWATIEVATSEEDIRSAIERLLRISESPTDREYLVQLGEVQRARTESMWNNVFSAIREISH